MKVTVMSIQRKRQRVTQITLANEIGVTQAEISLIERGLTNPKEETLEKIATVLNIPSTELLMEFEEWILKGVA
jgi:transcriptional regulator with XRE-family HTH domain